MPSPKSSPKAQPLAPPGAPAKAPRKVSRKRFRFEQLGLGWDLPGLVAGVDEAGRGPLAGPVFAAAVILDDKRPIRGLADSKVLTEKRREQLYAQIRDRALCCAVASASVEEIDTLNILQATMLAMRRALLGLAIPPQRVYVDGNRCPCPDGLGFQCIFEAVIKGDAKVSSISAASILAKTTRDALMCELDVRYPGFALSGHKGYGTPGHVAALNALGPSPLHRRSFAPCIDPEPDLLAIDD